MRRAAMIFGLLAAGVGQAAAPAEQAVARLEEVDVASRQVVADGMTWALSSTAAVRVPGLKRAGLRDLRPGMNVRMSLVPTTGESPVVSSITVLPD